MNPILGTIALLIQSAESKFYLYTLNSDVGADCGPKSRVYYYYGPIFKGLLLLWTYFQGIKLLLLNYF